MSEGKGYIEQTFRMTCGCGEWVMHTTESLAEFKSKRLQRGWSVSEEHGWSCPVCTQKLEAKDG